MLTFPLGTWSLIGAISDQPITTQQAYNGAISNEAHIDQRVRLNCNVMGLWLLQQSQKAWLEAGHNKVDYQNLAEQGSLLPALDGPTLDVNDQRFLAPHGKDTLSMPQRICNWFVEHGATLSEQPAVVARAIVEGLAAAYGQAIDHLRQLTGFSLTDLDHCRWREPTRPAQSTDC